MVAEEGEDSGENLNSAVESLLLSSHQSDAAFLG